MSRTTRKILPGYQPGGKIYEREKAEPNLRRPFERNHWFHGRDAYGGKLAIGEPFNAAPKGYTWDEIWGEGGKRYAKRAVARIHRRRGRQEANDWHE